MSDSSFSSTVSGLFARTTIRSPSVDTRTLVGSQPVVSKRNLFELQNKPERTSFESLFVEDCEKTQGRHVKQRLLQVRDLQRAVFNQSREKLQSNASIKRRIELSAPAHFVKRFFPCEPIGSNRFYRSCSQRCVLMVRSGSLPQQDAAFSRRNQRAPRRFTSHARPDVTCTSALARRPADVRRHSTRILVRPVLRRRRRTMSSSSCRPECRYFRIAARQADRCHVGVSLCSTIVCRTDTGG